MAALNASRRRVVVTARGLVSPLGDTPGAFAAALEEGRSGLGPSALATWNGCAAVVAGEVWGFAPETYFGDRNVRPLDRTSRLAAAAAGLALAEAGLAQVESRTQPVGLVLGTQFGSLKTIAEFDRRGLTAGPNYVKPLDFANSVINAPAGQTAIWHGLVGLNSTMAGGATAGLAAIGHATDLIRGGHAEALLAGGAEELSPEAGLTYGRAGLLAAAGSSPVPFGAGRRGFALGEGAALVLLEELEGARARGASLFGEVVGHASAFDPSMGQDPWSAASALGRAVRAAFADAGLGPGDLGAVVTGGSGSLELDLAEALGLASSLEEAAEAVPATAIKGALGEAFGASGGFQALALLEILSSGRLPGIGGLGEPEPGLALSLSNRPRAVNARTVLATALGLDGHAAALILTRSDAA
ncbi:MAG TPA: beta-ketoacyl synthase N-terminal-like domain-containing protein [Thermoanaerobaculia bacterium]|nr:beta-ketoacyl synthase N-terminal-like domain-containing protein [Thermoanaerobaculia bacterium]